MLETLTQEKILPPKADLPTQEDLPYEDNQPMETEQHRLQMELLISTLKPWLNQNRSGYVNGNMFVHFRHHNKRDFLGPDVFVVLDVSNQVRKSWVVWQEGKAPNIVIELLSDTTANHDKSDKKLIYQNELAVDEYYWFNPFNCEDWAGFELIKGVYQPISPDVQNRLISPCLGLALVRWHGIHDGVEAVWLRWATLRGELLLSPQEARDKEAQRANQEAQRATQEAQRANQEAQRANQETLRANQAEQRAVIEARRAQEAEAEIARLKVLLADKK